ncbi:MAG: phosphoribosyl-ATP diphosphatase [Rhodospirillaceae bacterium]|jgi:phosphoribosyl-ATP pyrophosphohydrolase|nr:phosphoribosyl-ATP diphosphatase [Rhodospirillales bacterium]MBT3904713.1 phosphoribosyl-ATP diphosphatase [Rhodospirillaceae bacterium]MBT4701599.1 phosphoribosyl-ATP diphosphatase [Rhodospirillaceae bacterium]MBT5036247.1 phosphoribosyl-ATP diphosphatase [Rhodospirillaceae bacterium]MBT6221619.1 phosphoribosyl-ATP diphosphatase [Rhodospirillaceae bacterium]
MTKDGNTAEVLERLFDVIETRRGADANSSYTASLLAEGTEKIAQKLGEEAIETIVAALSETPERVSSESADLLYHLMVLWADVGIDPSDVWAELAGREGTSGIAEKAARKA